MFFLLFKTFKEGYGKIDWQWSYKFFQGLFLDRKFLTKIWQNGIIGSIWGYLVRCKFFFNPLGHCHIYT